MPEESANRAPTTHAAAAGAKRAASPGTAPVQSTADSTANAGTAPESASSPSADKPEPKRAKKQHDGKRKVRAVRKANSDESVLEAVELLLRTKWKEAHKDADESMIPSSFGWPEGDKQSEATFCRAPPIPAKLAGADESDCKLDVYVHELTERGVGIATRETPEQLRELVAKGGRPWAFAVPFTLRGEKAQVKSVKHEWGYTQTDLLSVEEKSALRTDAPCKYFGKCSGCQLQHVGYEDQLEFKREVVERAFAQANPLFANLKVSPVSRSPLTFGYRTKLTPHFDIRKDTPPDQVAIGFAIAGQRRVMDIEECMIGTETVQRGAKKAREETKARMATYKRGATLLIRETNVPKDDASGDVANVPAAELVKDFVLDPKGWVTDVVEDMKFRYPASSFFQNNASILPAFTGFVRDELQKWSQTLASSTDSNDGRGPLKYLVDAYCGSGLFGIACHSGFEKVLGIEISKESISCANDNARMNGAENCDFLLGDATKIFEKVEASPDNTAVIIDPPRKGSSPDFLDQLVAYGPRVIVYVACGVPAQARDVNYMFSKGALSVDGTTAPAEQKPKSVYRIASVQPFDLFPQTYHVENIVTLVRED
ncbi:S-adenosyl-L-methionine-dependent methyltransferase [Martensiomyces pterosporus]|nr:S-adenosyl-L-methionine-dependent methyltransferase [Martensiomyces pterosporus]